MQVTQTNAEGLKREFKVVVTAGQIEDKVNTRLEEVGRTVRMPGFRPGKVPMPLLRKKYGPSIMGEVLEGVVNEGTRQAITDNDLRPAMQPKVEITSFDEGKDLEFKVEMELLPEIKTMDFKKVKLDREKAEASDEEITKAIERIAERNERTETVSGDRKSKSGDVAVIDFVGKVGGVEFAGGKAEGYSLKLGSGSFIPGFEDQLIGKKTGEETVVKVTFPEEYGSEELAGKDAEFDVKINELREVVPTPVDDELAKSLGLESLDALKTAVREEIEREYNAVSRGRVKRKLLDALEEGHKFDVPAGMIDLEFDAIWKQVEQDREQGRVDPTDEGKSDEQLKDDYRAIAERRVRLGLVLSEVGRANDVQVTQDDLNRAVMNEARRDPGQEHLVFQYYQSNQEALNALRAPVYEDKVVDFILELADVTDKVVSAEELMKEPEGEEEAQPKAKKAPAKKAAAKADADEEGEKKPAKKAPAKKAAKAKDE